MKLGEFFGSRETLHNEFKEFCIRGEACDAMYSSDEIKTILTNGVLDERYNLAILKSLESYINWYVPKYICAFLNAKIHGTIYIGIDDYGEITGIPFVGRLSRNKVEKIVKKTLKNNIYEYDKLHINVKVVVKKLDIDINILDNDDLSHLISQYETKNLENQKKMKEYNRKKTIWMKKISRYETKLVSILNRPDIRQELIIYLQTVALYSTEVTNDVLNRFLHTLSADRPIKVNSEIIDKVKNDKTNLLYWVMQFKDYMLQKLLESRPIRPKILLQTYPEMIFKRLSPLRRLFLTNNSNLNYYILKIEVADTVADTAVDTAVDKSDNGNVYYFKFPGQTSWTSKIRRCMGTEMVPACI